MLCGNLLYGQSGGPTGVINASAAGVIRKAQSLKESIRSVFAMKNGIRGLIHDELIDVSAMKETDLTRLSFTPGAFFGTVRYKLSDNENDGDYLKIAANLIKHNIRYLILNGGNDTMDTCLKLDNYLRRHNYECYVLGIPKTIDNDLRLTYFTPGFPSAARFIVNACLEIDLDNASYPEGRALVVETMGRHTGWLAAASALARKGRFGPDLVYVPEFGFDIDEFVAAAAEVYKRRKRCLIVVSEGLKDPDGSLLCKSETKPDAFGHMCLGGVGSYLSQILWQRLKIKAVPVQLSYLQRASACVMSSVDYKVAEMLGEAAAEQATLYLTGKMLAVKKAPYEPLSFTFDKVSLSETANYERQLPAGMYDNARHFPTSGFSDYLRPLIVSDSTCPSFDGGILDCLSDDSGKPEQSISSIASRKRQDDIKDNIG